MNPDENHLARWLKRRSWNLCRGSRLPATHTYLFWRSPPVELLTSLYLDPIYRSLSSIRISPELAAHAIRKVPGQVCERTRCHISKAPQLSGNRLEWIPAGSCRTRPRSRVVQIYQSPCLLPLHPENLMLNFDSGPRFRMFRFFSQRFLKQGPANRWRSQD